MEYRIQPRHDGAIEFRPVSLHDSLKLICGESTETCSPLLVGNMRLRGALASFDSSGSFEERRCVFLQMM